MQHISAYCLLVLGGNENPTKEDLQRVNQSIGVTVDDGIVEETIYNLQGKSIPEIIKMASEQFGYTPPAADQEEEKKAEEEKNEEEVDMGDLFGGRDDDY